MFELGLCNQYRNSEIRVDFGFCTMIASSGCPYADEKMSAVLAEVSLAVYKAYKEVPGLPRGDYDRDAIFRELTR